MHLRPVPQLTLLQGLTHCSKSLSKHATQPTVCHLQYWLAVAAHHRARGRPPLSRFHSLSAQGLGRLQDSAFGDLIVPIIVLLLCLISLGIGIGKVVNNASGVRTFFLYFLHSCYNVSCRLPLGYS